MRVLVTGAAGRLGGRLAELLAVSHDVVVSRHRSFTPDRLPACAVDLSQPGAFAVALEQTRPDAVVHAAAIGVDRCEADPELAEALNVRACEELGRAARHKDLRAIVLSTDLVFDGSRPNVRPGDEARPLMGLRYGRSKLAGEQVLLATAPDAVVARVALVVGRGFQGPTASESLLRGLRTRSPLHLYTDQFRTPVDPESVADALARMLSSSVTGVFHLGGPDRLSRHELGRRVAAAFSLPANCLVPVRQGERPLAAPRPLDVSLDSSRARDELGWTPRPLDDALLDSRSLPA